MTCVTPEQQVEHVLAVRAGLARVVANVLHQCERQGCAAHRVDVLLGVGHGGTQRRVATVEIAGYAKVGTHVRVVVFRGEAQARGHCVETREGLRPAHVEGVPRVEERVIERYLAGSRLVHVVARRTGKGLRPVHGNRPAR